ncbi:MAG: A24 family peptidase [Acidobacteriota bacterium]|nr:A24 family peptidase [Acidobacteriota bacterium]
MSALPPWIVWTLAALLGLVIGSFFNVCIHRLPRKQSLSSPPSRCGACAAPVAWRDNVPVLSYLLLGGRCRTCRAGIGVVYPLVELATMVLFLVHLYVFGPTLLGAARLVFACAMLVLFFIDLEHQILPNVITLPGVAAGLAASLFLPPGIKAALLGAVLGGGVLWAIAEIYVRTRGIEGMGMGDVKMLGMIGAFLGAPLMALTLVLASVAGALTGVALMGAGRGDLQRRLPFGTFLAAGAVFASLWGQPLVDWYAGFYR